jgi:hypothetical protein
MRTREEIEATTYSYLCGNHEVAQTRDKSKLDFFERLQLEVLLDIRDLLIKQRNKS